MDGACYFCGQLDESEAGGPSDEPPLQLELAEEEERPQQQRAESARHHTPPKHASPLPEGAEHDLRATIESLMRENAELRERLNEAVAAQQRSAAEAEALRQAGKAIRLRQQHSAAQLVEAEKAAAAAAKPLPPRPGAAGRKAGGILREPSASQVGAGRGRK